MGRSSSKPVKAPVVKDITPINPAEFIEYKSAFENGEMSKLKKKIDEDQDRWRKIVVNIAIIGNSGVGKSSFINIFRGIRGNCDGAAAVGVNETTEVPTKYVHPGNMNIALWDLPGVGTLKFPNSTYLQDVGFDKYDYFLIISSTRFTENDLWLAKEVHKLGKYFFFIRTKMNVDVENDKYDNPQSCKDVTVSNVRKAIETYFANGGLTNIQVFLIDSHFPFDYDFPILVTTMIDVAPKWKQEAMALTMTNLTESLIKRKKSILKRRILRVSLYSAIAAVAPLPGTSLLFDDKLVDREMYFYRKQFGPDDISLKKSIGLLEIPGDVEALEKRLNLSSPSFGTSIAKSVPFLMSLRVADVAGPITEIVFPVIGSIIGAGISYGNTVYILMSILNVFVSDALAINKELMKKLSAPSLSPKDHKAKL
ncbi:interferon-inducible GTPase 5-like [Ruditapes philippinarum]|uniref:interferon-inducible GTPase 5-like n=1 Tax=Ruditapes philippinarum TaxID=129788 RepID=UPI00295C099B|nr:interferon-inducible GTPase 5-like [Ruditapes philippinarum]